MNDRLERLRELLNLQKETETEINKLVGDQPATRRGRPRKADEPAPAGDGEAVLG